MNDYFKLTRITWARAPKLLLYSKPDAVERRFCGDEELDTNCAHIPNTNDVALGHTLKIWHICGTLIAP